jgi:UDP-N-acetylglucosamine/UDP-N-acetyl-alpha-D-glucosaminouronate 4-epimerase
MATSCLVTGGAGFIGSALVRALVARGDRVRVLDNFFSGKRENLTGVERAIELVEGDVGDEPTLGRALAGVELVFHEAAIPSVPRSLVEPVASHEANATATLKLLGAAREARVRRVVYAASSSAYGDTPTLPKVETMPPAPLSPYAVSKLTGELYCQVYAKAYGLDTVCLRYFNVFGPRQDPGSAYAAVIPRFVTAALAGARLTIYGDGNQSRDFCYVDDAVAANLLAAAAAASAVSGRVFNVAGGAATTLLEVARQLGELIGRTLEIDYAPARAGEVRHSRADLDAARAGLGYRPAIPLREGLRRTIAWYAEPR